MLSPAVMFIETAIKSPVAVPEWLIQSQLKELNSLGPTRAQQAGASGLTDDFRAGYQLGLATARVILAGSAALVLKGVKPGDVL